MTYNTLEHAVNLLLRDVTLVKLGLHKYSHCLSMFSGLKNDKYTSGEPTFGRNDPIPLLVV